MLWPAVPEVKHAGYQPIEADRQRGFQNKKVEAKERTAVANSGRRKFETRGSKSESEEEKRPIDSEIVQRKKMESIEIECLHWAGKYYKLII